ncbi:diguanylate cyclase [Permianibacter sp. IMCC34836]|uniref:diguanylate cyclase n=1 Tax=Permianibacter fluminis TaxID=2738515 RepID=UPI001553150A|nr:diguanylate cyclase [Permianibacter fluminis]NQD38667.1 diguanylate cyclase [Permianibacter fluminis]
MHWLTALAVAGWAVAGWAATDSASALPSAATVNGTATLDATRLNTTPLNTTAPDAAVTVVDSGARLLTLGSDDGLSQSTVQTIAQDRYGFIWLGTIDGLNRYDGHALRIWRRGERGLARSSINALCTDSQDGLWVGLFDGGVHRLAADTGQLEPLRAGDGSDNGPLPGRLNACLGEPSGPIWFATDTGLSRYLPAQNRFQHWPLAAAQQTDTGQRLLALQQDRNGVLYALSGQAVYRVDNGLQAEAAPTTLAGRAAFSSFLLDGDDVLIGTDNGGLWRWSRRDNSLTAIPLPRFNNPLFISAILRDHAGRLWLGTSEHGVLMQAKPGERWQQLRQHASRHDSLADDHVLSLFESTDGVVWIGTWLGGVSRIDPNQASFHVLRSDPAQPDSLPVSSVRSILAEPDALWVGTDGGGLSLSRDDGEHFQHFQHAPNDANSPVSNHIRVIFRDRAQRLWLGTDGGLDRLDRDRSEQRKFVHVRMPPGTIDSDNQQHIRALSDDAEGNLWIGTWGAGLLRYQPASQRFETIADACGNRVVVLQADLDDSLLIGSDDGGLCRRSRDGTITRLLPANFSVWSLHVDADAIWVGSYGDSMLKLHRRSQRIHRFDQRNGLSNDSFYAILPDNNGRLWLSSNDGLFRFHPDSEKADAYPVSAGLQDREFNSGAGARRADGRLYFGGIKGLNWFEPDQVTLNDVAPRSTISDLQVMQKDWPAAVHSLQQLVLPANQNMLALSFSAQHYSTPSGNKYRYRLRPLESDWNELDGGQHQAYYSQLAPGHYQFELRAGSAAGIWDSAVRTLNIEIQPTFWNSTLARISYTLLGGALLLLLLAQRQRIRNQERALLTGLQQQVASRTRELQEKNDALEKLNSELQHANSRLDTMSLTDPMTGLGNRRMLFRYLEKDAPAILRLHQDGKQQNLPIKKGDLLFFLIDIDHFKRINDSFGHDAGDEVLLAVKDRLQHICREQDYLVRYGGEEFLLVSRYSDRDSSPQLAERIRSVIGDHPFSLSNGARLPVTCSLGYAAFPLNRQDVAAYTCEQVLQVADCLLYAAKHSGRNQWVGAVSTQESRPDLLLHRLRENGASAVATGDVELQYSQRSLRRLRWRADDTESLTEM